MIPQLCISAIQLSGGTELVPNDEEIILVVGPNNSGKSEFLKAIQLKLNGPTNFSPVIRAMNIQRHGSPEDVLTWAQQRGARRTEAQGGTYTLWGQALPTKAITQWWMDPTGQLSLLTSWFCRLLSTEQRLQAAAPQAKIDIRLLPPSHRMHLVEIDDRLESRLSTYFRRAFGVDLILDRAAGSHLRFMVGLRPPLESGEDRISQSYLAKIGALPPLELQGDGMRSFAGLALEVFCGEEPIVLIDEPETFLHPPQARLIGKMLSLAPVGEANRTKRQIFVATHSSDILSGVLLGGGRKVRVARIIRDGANNQVEVLDNESVARIWRDPLLKFSNILDGLFHDRVVLCESDGDCRFFSAVADALYAAKGPDFRPPDILFTHCGGKNRMPMVANALAELKVPIIVAADFDVLFEEQPLRGIVEALGLNWSAYSPDWKITSKAISDRRPELASEEAASEIGKILEGFKERIFPERAADLIRAVLKKASPWAFAKSTGLAYVPIGEQRAAANRLIEALAECGILVNPHGELECLLPTVGGHGPLWVERALQRDIKNDPELSLAREFVSKMAF